MGLVVKFQTFENKHLITAKANQTCTPSVISTM